MITAILIVAALCVLIAIIIAIRTHRESVNQNKNMKAMIEAAIEGNFLEHNFDETTLSQLESKLAEYLSGNEIAQGNIAEERDKIKTMIADISHQTKTPISNLLLYGEMLQESDVTGEASEYAMQMTQQAEKLKFLIDALVKLSRLEAGILKLHPESGDVQDMLEYIVKDYAPKAETKGLKLSKGNLSAKATFDEKWTREAIANVVDNAIKYTKQGEVKISVRDFAIFTAIDVKDTGIGVPEGEHAEIFGRFYRGKQVHGQDGVGIGLFLAREIITGQGGYIKLKSGDGGSTFSIFLPKE